MIPYRDENRVGGFPLMTWALIIINFAVFIQELLAGARGSQALQSFVTDLGVVPYRITHHVQPGWPAPHPEAFTLVTAMFLHAGWFHLIGNMLYLFIFGPDIEYLTGRLRFVIFYVTCGVVAGLTQVLLYPDSHVVALGASGAIAGVLGAFILFFGGNTIDAVMPVGCFPLFLRLRAAILIGGWFLLQVALAHTETATAGGIGYAEHVSGFIAGMLLIFAFKVRPVHRSWT